MRRLGLGALALILLSPAPILALSVATTGFWETHTKKSGTGNVSVGNVTLTSAQVGQLLTLEGGLGKSFLEGAASVGLAYYASTS